MIGRTMTSRERVRAALHHDEPDRPPIFATLTPRAARKLSDALGLPYEEPIDSMLSTRASHMDLLTALGNDCVGIAASAPKAFPTKHCGINGVVQNEWGMTFVDTGSYFEFYQHPLAHASSVGDVSAYPLPDPAGEGVFDNACATANKYKDRFVLVGDIETSFFETSWYLTGLEKFLMDLALEESYVFALMDRVREIYTTIGRRLIALGAEIIWAGDDFGGQQGMLLDPRLWRRHIKPRIGEMFQELRRGNAGTKIAWHSCGSILPIIPDFIDLGLDILNPIQPAARGMDPSFLKREYGQDLTFFGGIDIQHLLPFGSAQDIHAEVHRRIDILGKGGGYIVAPAHNIQEDVPVENVLALFDAVRSWPEIPNRNVR
jgi:uroporphyrinogen decarboxylase